MGGDGYADIRIQFVQRGPREYEVSAMADDGSSATSTFVIPLTAEQMDQAIVALGNTRSPTRKATVVDVNPISAELLGSKLAEALFAGDVAALYDRLRNSSKVRLTLLLGEEPELLSIPWEFLYRQSLFLAAQRSSPIVRELETAAARHDRTVDGRLRMLGVVSSPTGLPQLDVVGEVTKVDGALRDVQDRVDVEWLGVRRDPTTGEMVREPCTFTMLREKLRDSSFHILHFVGHSAFENGESSLFLTTDTGGVDQVSATKLAQLLGDQSSLQLVVLNSCEGARTTADDPFAGIATKIVQQGCGAVVAMQFEITDEAAKKFAGEFYTSLVDRHLAVDQAMAEARKAIWDVSEVEFATPVLFLRRGDAQLFDFVAAGPADVATAQAPTPGPTPPPAPPQPQVLAPTPPPPVAVAPKPAPHQRRRVLIGAGVAAIVIVIGLVVALSRSGDNSDTASGLSDPSGSVAEQTTDPADTQAVLEPETAAPVPVLDADGRQLVTTCLDGDLFAPGTIANTINDVGQGSMDAINIAFAECARATDALAQAGIDAGPGTLPALINDRVEAAAAAINAAAPGDLDDQADALRTQGFDLLDAIDQP